MVQTDVGSEWPLGYHMTNSDAHRELNTKVRSRTVL